MYRERDWPEADRRQQKQKKKTNWLLKGGFVNIQRTNPNKTKEGSSNECLVYKNWARERERMTKEQHAMY